MSALPPGVNIVWEHWSKIVVVARSGDNGDGDACSGEDGEETGGHVGVVRPHPPCPYQPGTYPYP
eukprot:4128228-Pyramimonas_sp.AAC.1